MGGLLFRIREAGGNLQKPHKGGVLPMIQKLDNFCRRNICKGGGRQGINIIREAGGVAPVSSP